MKRFVVGLGLCGTMILAAPGGGMLGNDNGNGNGNGFGHGFLRFWSARMTPSQEAPAVSSTARGSFSAEINADAGTIEYELNWDGLVGTILQAHLHFGQRGVSGGITLWLCENLPPPTPPALPSFPTGTQKCTVGPDGTVTGTLAAANVVGPAGQGIAAGEMAEVIAAIRRGEVYANVHSTIAPGGEIRGQLVPGRWWLGHD